jgi:hypothetical protein
MPAMIQFKWVEKEEEKDFTACTSANDFLLWKQKFCTQSQLCRRHRFGRMMDAGFQLSVVVVNCSLIIKMAMGKLIIRL